METLETVIDDRARDFVRLLVSQFGFTEERAEKFVILAGSDLMESYRWRADDIGPGQLSDPENVRELLGAIRGNHIASSLGLPPSDVWSGLRVFVPRVLQLADGRPALDA
jgi:hypothetical protein